MVGVIVVVMIGVIVAAMVDMTMAAMTDMTMAALAISLATLDEATPAQTLANSVQRRHDAKQIPWEGTDATGKTWLGRDSARCACETSPAALYA